MTEDEAKRAPCIRPSAYLLQDNGPCIGSACRMAWRWAEPYAIDQHGVAHNYNRKADDKTGRLTRVQSGYCGLAGKP